MNTLLKIISIALIGLGGTTVIHSMIDARSDSDYTVVAEWTKEQHETFRKNCHDKYKVTEKEDNGNNGNGRGNENGNNRNAGQSASSPVDTEQYCDCMAEAMQDRDYGPEDMAKASKEMYSESSFCILSTLK